MALGPAELARGIAGPRATEERSREREAGQRSLASALIRAIETKDAVALMNALRELVKSVDEME